MTVDTPPPFDVAEKDQLVSFSAFAGTCAALGSDASERLSREVYQELLEKHSESHRGHHVMEHISECLALTETFLESEKYGYSLEEILAVFWFHDIVYVPGRADNEKQSSETARQMMIKLGIDPVVIAKVARLILSTSEGSSRTTEIEQFVHDVDYWVVGSGRYRYIHYMRGIEKEFSSSSLTLRYRFGRIRFLLRTLMGRDIFDTDQFRDAFEKQAKSNIRFELLYLLTH